MRREGLLSVMLLTIAAALATAFVAGSAAVGFLPWLESALVLFAVLCAALINRAVFFAAVFALCFLGFLGLYYQTFYGIVLNTNIISVAFEANIHEIAEHSEHWSYVFVLGLSALVTGLIWLCRKQIFTLPWHRRGAFITAGWAGVAYAVILAPRPVQHGFPLALVQEFQSYYEQRQAVVRQASARTDISKLSSKELFNVDELTVVLSIGESVRSDHLQINGYGRPTTPELASLPGLVSFPDVLSCSAVTRTAVPCLLTRVSVFDERLSFKETSLLSLFKKHGYEVTWISLNDIYGFFNAPVSVIANEADYKFFRLDTVAVYDHAYDQQLLDMFRHALKERKQRKRLFVLHGRGSHYNYAQRYPPAFRRFKPDCARPLPECSQEAIINSYDNSLYYSDYIHGQILGLLKDIPALMVYVADHGESLGEDGVYLHGLDHRREQRSVPMWWWWSEGVGEALGAKLRKVKAQTAKNLTHDNLFHSLLDCVGIHSVVVDQRQSLCSDGMKSIAYDWDAKKPRVVGVLEP